MRIEDPWVVPRLTPFWDGGEGEEFIPVDCLPMNTGCDGPILSPFARDVLEEVIGPGGEFWPVKVLDHDYWWFNCLALGDALDIHATEAEWETAAGEWGTMRWITTVRRLAFRPEIVASMPGVFRVGHFPHDALFAREAVTDAVARHGLTGFKLDPVWSAAEGGVLDPAGFGLAGIFDEIAPFGASSKRAQARMALEGRRA